MLDLMKNPCEIKRQFCLFNSESEYYRSYFNLNVSVLLLLLKLLCWVLWSLFDNLSLTMVNFLNYEHAAVTIEYKFFANDGKRAALNISMYEKKSYKKMELKLLYLARYSQTWIQELISN